MDNSTVGGKRGLHAQMVRNLGSRILRGEYLPGETLPNESILGGEYGVSRTVLREAVKVLADKGFVETRPKRGTQVLPREHWKLIDSEVLEWHSSGALGVLEGKFIRDLSDVRLIIEPAAAERAAARASDEEIGRIVEYYRRMEATVAESAAFIEADMAFHNAIMASCHNEMLRQMTDAIQTALVVSRQITTRLEHASELALPLHRAVAEAIRRRDPAGARSAMAELIARSQQDLETVLGTDQAFLAKGAKKGTKKARG